LSTLLQAFIISLTVTTVLAIGIFAAYGAVIAILHAFASSRKRAASPVLVSNRAHAAHAGGD
jgi:hypothetical protein